MPLVTTTEMFQKAYDGGYAIGAFNVNNMEIIQGITEAAREVNSPLILQVSAGRPEVCQATSTSRKLVEAAIEDTGLPIGPAPGPRRRTLRSARPASTGGFTSVMIDAGSKHSFEDNIALTRQVVEYAHAHGVVVEGRAGPPGRHRGRRERLRRRLLLHRPRRGAGVRPGHRGGQSGHRHRHQPRRLQVQARHQAPAAL